MKVKLLIVLGGSHRAKSDVLIKITIRKKYIFKTLEF